MDDLHVFSIALVALLVVGAIGWSFFVRIGNWRRKKHFHELEVKIRMESGWQKIQDMRQLALLYQQQGDLWTADKYLSTSLQMAESELGLINPGLIPLLEEYRDLLKKMKRKLDVRKIEKRLADIRKS